MSVFLKLHRYRFPFLLIILSLVAVLVLGDQFVVVSRLTTLFESVNSQKTLVAEKTTTTLVTENVNKTVLQNGLTVLTKEVHTAPVVTVQVWYKVGSRNEEPGLNGIAHQLEHMMFRGTGERPLQFGRLFSALGSDSNAFTSYDQTAYYNTAQSNKLQALLTLEADRMRNARIDAESLAGEKRVVISELQGYENSPDYRLSRSVMLAAFPNHPYGLPVGGTKSDVEKFEVDQVRKYYDNFYSPDNAVLVVVGDFQTTPTLKVVEEIFGQIPNHRNREEPQPVFSSSPIPLSPKTQAPVILQEPGAAALLQAVYPLPNINHPDVPLLDVMDYILTEGRNSRLYQALIESGLASEITAAAHNLLDFGWYEVLITASSGQNLKKIDSIVQREFAKLAQKGVTIEEVNRAKAQLEAAVILDNRDITSIAMQLGNDETTASDYQYTERYLEGVRSATATDIQRVAQEYLKPEARTVGFFKPTQIQSKTIASKVSSTQTPAHLTLSQAVDPVEVKKYLPNVEAVSNLDKSPEPQAFTLDNGLRVLLLPDTSTPTVTLSGHITAGAEFDPEEQAGLASIVADNLLNGTKTKDFLAIAKSLDDQGADLSFDAYREGVQIEGNSLAADLPILMQTLADVLKNATFPKKELEITRQQALAILRQDLDSPSEVAKRIFIQTVYPRKHPLHSFPTKESLKRIKREDVIAFKTKHYRPDATVLALVGNFEPDQVKSLIAKQFGDWVADAYPPSLQYPPISLPDKVVKINSVLPGKAQAIIYMGSTAINRQDPRFYAALVLNQILGGDTLSSRLGAEVRDRQGLTYGIYSNFLTGKNSGTFLIELQTSPEDAQQAIASTQELLQKIHQQGVSPSEVEVAKHTLISNYTISLANPDELTDIMLMNAVYGLEQAELRLYSEKLQEVSLDQVNKVAQELLYPDRIVVVTAGPAVSID